MVVETVNIEHISTSFFDQSGGSCLFLNQRARFFYQVNSPSRSDSADSDEVVFRWYGSCSKSKMVVFGTVSTNHLVICGY